MGQFMKKEKIKRIAKGILACGLIVQSFIFAPSIYAEEFSDIVSVRTVDRDIMIGTTENSLFGSEDIAKNINLETSLANQSYKMSTTQIDATDLSNWYVYDHYDKKAYADEAAWEKGTGYNKSLRPYYVYEESPSNVSYQEPLSVDEALDKSKETAGGTDSANGNVYYLKEHISASSENGNAAMKFYGYGITGCCDFLFYPAQETGVKRVEYTINAKDVKTHSLAKAGFLFNCGIRDGNLSGYAMMFSFKDGIVTEEDERNVSASGIQDVCIYKITDIPVASIHEGNVGFPSYQSDSITEIKKVDLSSIPFAGHFDISNIEMMITNTSLRVYMTEAGELAGDNPEKKTLIDIQNQDSQEDTYLESYTSSGLGGFGPIVSYEPHSCQYTSSYIYSNLKMSITESDSILSGLSNSDYTKVKRENGKYVDNDKYFVLIGDNTEGENGFKDCFKRDYDDVYLEMLKKQGVVLITNLNIENKDGNINGTNYNLKEYLGENNVIQIYGDTLEELSTNIEQAILNLQYSRDDAEQAKDALDIVTGTGHDDHATARCVVTYNGLQVDTINISRLGTDALELLIDDSLSINVTNPTYTLRYPDGSTKILPNNKITIQKASDWPTGEYVVNAVYPEKVSAKTSFSILSAHNSYFNGANIDEGVKDDHLSCFANTIGVNRVAEQKSYITGLVADDGYQLPQNIVVKTDTMTTGTITDSDGVVRDNEGNPVELTTLVRDEDYTYDSSTGEIEVKEQCITGNVYIYADTAKVTYNLTHMTAGENPVTNISSYDNSDLTVNLATDLATLNMPESVYVTIAGEEYEISQGKMESVLNGTISYLGNRLHISSPLLGNDITIRAAVGAFKLHYISNLDCIEEGGDTVDISYGQDYNNVLKIAQGYAVAAASAAYGLEVDDPLKRPDSFSFNTETCAVHIDGEDIVDDIYITITARKSQYDVTADVTNLVFNGESFCMVDRDYSAQLTPEAGYALPDTIRVTVDGEDLSGYKYSPETGELQISKNMLTGNVTIIAGGKVREYPVHTELGNLSYQGDATGNIEQNYKAVIAPYDEYALPANVTIKVGGQILPADAYSYDAIKGEIEIFKGQIKDDVLIQADANKVIKPAKEYYVLYRLTNLSTDGSEKATDDKDYITTLRPNEGYNLPATFTVTSGDNLLVQGVDYGYNGITGVVTIPAESIAGNIVIEAAGHAITKTEQKKPDVNKLVVIPPKYENSFDGKIIGVTTAMEYSVDGGKSWTKCKGEQITGLGTGKVSIRFYATGTKSSSPIASIELDSATMEYYIPTISMSKMMGRNKKFQLKIKNTKGAAVKVSSSNPSIVKVNKKGLITSKKKTGKAKVVVAIIKGKHIVQYVANVKVVKKVKKNYSLSKFKTSYKAPTIALYKKLTKGKKWKIKMTHTKNTKISFQSSNKSVATVSKSGVVKGKRSGNTRIMITVANGNVVDKYYVVLRVFKKGERSDLSYLKEIK